MTVSALRMEEAGSKEFKGHIKQEQKNNPDTYTRLCMEHIWTQEHEHAFMADSLKSRDQQCTLHISGAHTCLALTG